MIDGGKQNLLGVLVDAVDYDAAVRKIIASSKDCRALGVTALAVHGVMTGVGDRAHRYRLNHLELVTPDGQPVRWGLNLLHRTGLRDRVYGPTLMLKVCEVAAQERLALYLYGSRQATLDLLVPRLRARFPGVEIAGAEPSKFRKTSTDEKSDIVERIKSSGAAMAFVGLGCPRQEVFAYEYRVALQMPVIAVGVAFDYHAGVLTEPPMFMQRWGFQWLYRLVQEPRRLWKRYLITNTSYAGLLVLQAVRFLRPDPLRAQEPRGEVLYG